LEIVSSFEAKDIRKPFYSPDGIVFYIDDNDLFSISIDGDVKPKLIASDLDGKKGDDPARKPNNNIMGIWDDKFGNVNVAVYNKRSVIQVNPKTGLSTIIYTSPLTWGPSGGLIYTEQNLWVMEYNITNEVRVKKINKQQFLNKIVKNNSKSILSSIYILCILLTTILVAIIIGNNLSTTSIVPII